MHDRSPGRTIVALLPILMTFAVVAAQEPKVTGAPAELNRRFVDPEMDIDRWVTTFEGESREVFAERHEVLRAIGVREGDRVADVGAGSGLYTRLFAKAAGPKGRVYAVEISPRFIEHIDQTSAEAGLANVVTVLGRVDSITLPPDSVDLVFACDTYHHFEAVEPTLASIHQALARGGRFVVVEFDRIPGQSREWVLDHVRAGKNEFRSEIEAAGFSFAEEIEIPGFKETYLHIFKKK